MGADISCPERTSGAKILEETSQMINQKEIKKYSCCLVGCVFQVTKYSISRNFIAGLEHTETDVQEIKRDHIKVLLDVC